MERSVHGAAAFVTVDKEEVGFSSVAIVGVWGIVVVVVGMGGCSDRTVSLASMGYIKCCCVCVFVCVCC